MKARDWIDRVKVVRGLPSDYAAAKLLGLSRHAVSGYRIRPEATFEVAVSAKVAHALGLSLIAVMVDQEMERCKIPDIHTTLKEEAARLCILCKTGRASKKIAAAARPVWATPGFH